MPREKRRPRVVRAFVATPRDTDREVTALSTAIENINRVTGRTEGFRIELIYWKTDTHPAVGPDTQSVVTEQIGEYDLLIVIFNQAFGSRTPRANSGTEEEYDRAFLKYLRDTRSVQILIYFANPMVRLHEIDPVALGQIKQFRRRLEKEGVLYQIYHDISEFERLASLQITTACRSYLSGNDGESKEESSRIRKRESRRLEDWIAESRLVLPQSANYLEIDLTSHRRSNISFGGYFQSSSKYYRFGFKLSGIREPLFGDASIQTADPNMVFHIGKNKADKNLFYTVYRNGRRFGRDRLLVSELNPTSNFYVGFTISENNVVEFKVADKTVHEDRLPNEARERLALLAWADENECTISFTNILLETTNQRK